MIVSRGFAIVLIVIGASSYGLLSALIKLAYDQGWNVSQITVSQITVGTLILWLLVLIQPKSWSNPFKGPWFRLVLTGILGLSLTTIFYNTALNELDASLTIVLLFQFTWITIVMESVAHKKWPSLYQLLAIVLVMFGTILAVNILAVDITKSSLSGIGYGLASAASYSFFLFMAGRIESNMTSLLRSALMLTGSLPFIYFLYPPVVFLHPHALSLLGWGALLGMLGQVIPTIFFNIGIPKVGGSMAAMLGSMELPVGILGALIILNEPVLPVQWLGIGLILVGIMVSEVKAGARQ